MSLNYQQKIIVKKFNRNPTVWENITIYRYFISNHNEFLEEEISTIKT